MKNNHYFITLLVTFLWAATTSICLAQSSSDSEKDECWTEYEKQADEQVKAFKEKNPYTPFYQLDIKKIEIVQNLYISRHATTFQFCEAAHYAKDEYDKLLNKYYKILMSKLTPQDKITLRTAQRAWLKFYESNTELGPIISGNPYKGGGTMWRPMGIDFNANTIKYRVMELGDLIVTLLGEE